MSIRLIAADMDGTLLDSRKQLPEGLFPLVRALHERGVRFAPASGRQFYTLYEQFGEIADELMYISENGAMPSSGCARCLGPIRSFPPGAAHFTRKIRLLRRCGISICTVRAAQRCPILRNSPRASRSARSRCAAPDAPSRCSCRRLPTLPDGRSSRSRARTGSTSCGPA